MMTLYLTETTDPADVAAAAGGLIAAKLSCRGDNQLTVGRAQY